MPRATTLATARAPRAGHARAVVPALALGLVAWALGAAVLAAQVGNAAGDDRLAAPDAAKPGLLGGPASILDSALSGAAALPGPGPGTNLMAEPRRNGQDNRAATAPGATPAARRPASAPAPVIADPRPAAVPEPAGLARQASALAIEAGLIAPGHGTAANSGMGGRAWSGSGAPVQADSPRARATQEGRITLQGRTTLEGRITPEGRIPPEGRAAPDGALPAGLPSRLVRYLRDFREWLLGSIVLVLVAAVAARRFARRV